MTSELGYLCSRCGVQHAELPTSYGTAAPDVWDASLESRADSMLSDDLCVVRDQHFFIKGLIEIPVVGSDEVFCWGVWVSLSRDSYSRAVDRWEEPGRERERPYFGWLSTELAVYSPGTTNLATNVHTRPVGERPFVELEPTDHPLAVEQRTGIGPDRIRAIAAAVRHGGGR
ncbi:hypothetical protein Athai_45610 [Actinocatenispora thailandica]|uniref:DUF2199 domain-containing protein n=1 Tax=Actinocatenispora thailandica TaxID=227318 RepID=A0A7R7HZF2_9ACTN|nr:DUF2199 domain-containing protein [Actinocatenispora thailandica]BCJ37058.1 hypothetical protein Athai_45610 [Actinocatenispora thailandica]